MTTRTGSLIDRRNWDADAAWYRQGMLIGWYDRDLRLWTVFRIDGNGYQISPTRYYCNAEQLLADGPRLDQLGSVVPCDWVRDECFDYSGYEFDAKPRQTFAFQTGRQYSTRGQRIGWTVQNWRKNPNGWYVALCVFSDVDRGIHGAVQCIVDADGELPTNGEILSAYDRGGYSANAFDYELVRQCYNAAAKL